MGTGDDNVPCRMRPYEPHRFKRCGSLSFTGILRWCARWCARWWTLQESGALRPASEVAQLVAKIVSQNTGSGLRYSVRDFTL